MFRDPTRRVRDIAFAERNWHDYAARGRAARSERFKYIHNEDHEYPLTPPADAARSPTFRAMRLLRDSGRLMPKQRTCFELPRPAEELYDLDADPDELVNLAADSRFAEELGRMRRALADWAGETGDIAPAKLTPDEFDRETGEPLPGRVRPRRRPAESGAVEKS
jgi:arylsulfatase A-like enzyme